MLPVLSHISNNGSYHLYFSNLSAKNRTDVDTLKHFLFVKSCKNCGKCNLWSVHAFVLKTIRPFKLATLEFDT